MEKDEQPKKNVGNEKIFGLFCFYFVRNAWNMKWNVYDTRLESLTRDMF